MVYIIQVCKCCLTVIVSLMLLIPTIQTDQPLRLLSLLPYPNYPTTREQPAFDGGPALYIASQFAVEVINNRTDILPGYTVELIQGDCGCDLINTMEISLFEHIIYNELNIHGVVGPGCSESTLFLGRQIAQPAFEVLSLSLAGSEELGDRIDHPNSYSAIDSAHLYVEAIEAIVKSNKWESVSVFHDLSRNFFTSIRTQLEPEETNSTTPYHFMSVFAGNLRYTSSHSLPLQCEPVSRITVFLASADVIRELICLFATQEQFHDVVYPHFQFVIVNRTPQSIIKDTSFLFGNQTINCTASQISDRLNGSVFLEYRFIPSNLNVTTATGMTYTQFETLYKQRLKEFNDNNAIINSDEEILESVWGSVYFDSTWALALALNNSRNELMEAIGLELSQYRPGHSNATAIMRKELERIEFNGVSGNFTIGSNGFVKRLVDIRQFFNGQFQRHDHYDSTTGNISNFEHEEEGVDYIEWNFKRELVSDSVKGALLICLILFFTLLIFAIHIVSTLNTNHPSIKATNPKLYHFSYVGTYIQSTATIIYIVGDTLGVGKHCFLLHFSVVALSTGSVLVFAALTAISFRIYRIFVHYMHPGILIRDGFLLGFIIVTTSVYFICCFVVSVVYQPSESRFCVNTHQDTVLQRSICHYQYPQWILVTLVIPIVLTVLAVGFSLLSFRKVTIKQFKTNSFVVICFFSFINTGVWLLYYEFQVIGEATNPSLGPVVGLTGASLVARLLFLYLPPSLPVLGDYYQAHLRKYCSPCCHKSMIGMYAHNKDNASNTDDSHSTDDARTTTDSMLYRYSYSKSQDNAIVIPSYPDPVCSLRACVQITVSEDTLI